ncbi:MAG: apolipoprotein N-acyltransferase [Pseudomonadota bacterium]
MGGVCHGMTPAVPPPEPTRPTVAAPEGGKPWLRLPVLLLASTLSGIACFLAGPDFDLWPLGWVMMVPALWAIERAASRRTALLCGLLVGVAANTGGFYWVVGLLERFAGLPWYAAIPLLLLLSAYQALVFVLFAWAVRSLRRQPNLPLTPTPPTMPMAVVAPLAMVTFELLLPFVFPWNLAITQAWLPHVIQIADLAGPLGVTALLMLANGAVYDLIVDRRLERRRRWLVAGSAAAVVLAVLGYGHYRIGQVTAARTAAPTVTVGVVQPNVGYDMKGLSHQKLAANQLRALQEQSRRLENSGAELLVWPESSYPYGLGRDLAGDAELPEFARIRKGFTAPLVFGALTSSDDDLFPFNSALMLEPDGRVSARFDKMFLVLFSEHIPGIDRFPSIAKLLPPGSGNLSRGKRVVTLPFRAANGTEWRLGPMICFEDTLPAFGRLVATEHPHLLVNLTNDAWFGDTSEPWQHLALSVFRAVELRTDLVRAVNTGVSAFIDGAGRVYARTYSLDPAKEPRDADAFLEKVALLEGGHTVFARFGNVFGYLCAALTGLLLVLPRLRRRLRHRWRASSPRAATPTTTDPSAGGSEATRPGDRS